MKQDDNTHISLGAINTSCPETQEENSQTKTKCILSSLSPRTSSVNTIVPDINHVIKEKQDSMKHSKTCSASLYIFNSKGKRCATVKNDYLDNQLGML